MNWGKNMSTQIGISTNPKTLSTQKCKIISPLNFKNMSVQNYQNLPTLDPENMSIQICKNISSKIQIPEPFIDLKHATINATQLSEGMTFPAGPHYAPAGPQAAGMRHTMRHSLFQHRAIDIDSKFNYLGIANCTTGIGGGVPPFSTRWRLTPFCAPDCCARPTAPSGLSRRVRKHGVVGRPIGRCEKLRTTGTCGTRWTCGAAGNGDSGSHSGSGAGFNASTSWHPFVKRGTRWTDVTQRQIPSCNCLRGRRLNASITKRHSHINAHHRHRNLHPVTICARGHQHRLKVAH